MGFKKFLGIGLAIVAVASLSNPSDVMASGCSYGHSVSCSDCSDVAKVSERFDFYEPNEATSSIDVYKGIVDESQQALYVDGRAGNKYGREVLVDVLYRYNVSGQSSTYYWHNEYDFYGARAYMTFDIRKGTNWDTKKGFWQ